jgi:hypothetical protein
MALSEEVKDGCAAAVKHTKTNKSRVALYFSKVIS